MRGSTVHTEVGMVMDGYVGLKLHPVHEWCYMYHTIQGLVVGTR